MTTTGHLDLLSRNALRLAAHLPGTDQDRLARWLYDFGRVPRTPAVDRDLGPDDEPMGVLGLSRGASVRRMLEQRYVASADEGWYSFFPRPLDIDFRAVCKLYLSPRPDTLADVFPLAAATFVTTDVASFKVGRGREGLLRADKIVAYFADRGHAGEVAVALDRALAGCPPQGVPFTAELCGDGLVSWGEDPDQGTSGTSWRSWITQRLATSLAAPGPEGDAGTGEVVARSLADLRAVGVDPDRWARDGADLPLPGMDRVPATGP